MTAPFADAKLFAFDAYGTLFDFAAAARRCTDQLGARADELTRHWRAKQVAYSWHRSLTGHHADFWQVTGDALDHAMATLGLSDAALRERLMQLYLALDPFPDARATLERLRAAGRPVAILSNGSPAMLEAVVGAAGFTALFDRVLSIESAGVFKPHPASYRLATSAWGIEPAEVAFVSANPWDCAGAAAFGFRVIAVDRTGEPEDILPGRPAAHVRALAEIPALAGLA